MSECSSRKGLQNAVLTGLGVAALIALFFTPVWVHGRLLAPGDAINYSLPAFSSPVQLWSNLLGCGVPLAADPQQQMWYPVALICKAIGSFNLLVMAAYFIAACSMFAFVLSETGSKLAATISGITYSLCGFMSAHLGHTTMIHAAAWIPLLLLSISKLKNGFRANWFFAGQIAIAFCFLGGHTQIFVTQLIVGGAFCLFTAIRQGKSWFKLLVTGSCLLLVGIGLCAIQLFPTTELAHASIRESLPYETFVSFSLPQSQLVQQFFPFICLAPLPCFTPSYGQSPYFGEWNITELCGYAGILPFMLSVVALLARKADKSKWFFLAIAVLGIVASLGGATAMGKLLFSIPVINYFRCPGRYLLLFDLAVSVLAGVGIAALQKLPDTRTRLHLVTLSSVTTAALMSLLFGYSFNSLSAHYKAFGGGSLDLSPLANAYVGLPIVVFFAAFVMLVIWGWKPSAKSFTSALVLVTLLDLSSCAAFCEWKFKVVTSDMLQPPAVVTQHRQEWQQAQSRIIAPFGTDGAASDCVPNISSLWNVPAVTYYSPLETARASALFEDKGTAFVLKACANRDATLDLASARYFVMPKSRQDSFQKAAADGGTSGKDLSSRFSVVSEPNSELIILENKRAVPRFRFVDKVIQLDANETLRVIKASAFSNHNIFDPATTALVDERVVGLENTTVKIPEKAVSSEDTGVIGARATKVDITVRENKASEITIDTEHSKSGLLVIADQYYKGWICTVDGKESKIVRTNYAFKGVYVPAGKHLVKLEYRPKSFFIGLGISILSLITTLALVIYCRSSKPRQQKH